MQMADVSETSCGHGIGLGICVPFPSLPWLSMVGEDMVGGESGHEPMPSEVPSFGTWGLRPDPQS